MLQKKIRMKSSQLHKQDIFRKNSLTLWYQNLRDIPCLTSNWCTQQWRQNIKVHNFSGVSLAGGEKTAIVSSNRWYLHACNSLRLRFLFAAIFFIPRIQICDVCRTAHTIVWTKKTIIYNHDQSNSPTHYISKPDIDIYQYRPIKRWLELPKTTQIKNDIFEKVLKCGGRTLRNLQAGRNCSLGTRVRSDYSWVLAKGDPGNTYGKACQAYCRQKSKGVSVRTIDVNYISRIWPHGFGPPPYNHNERSKFHMDNGNRRW